MFTSLSVWKSIVNWSVSACLPTVLWQLMKRQSIHKLLTVSTLSTNTTPHISVCSDWKTKNKKKNTRRDCHMQTWSGRQQAVCSQHRPRAGHRGCKKYKKYKTTKIRGLSTPMKTKHRQRDNRKHSCSSVVPDHLTMDQVIQNLAAQKGWMENVVDWFPESEICF